MTNSHCRVGKIAVSLFFTISGYVLSYSPLSLIQARPDGVDLQLASKIGTAFARRWIRLFLPVIVVTFAFMASWYVTYHWKPSDQLLNIYRHLFHLQSALGHGAAPKATFAREMVRWLTEFLDHSYVFKTTQGFGTNDYNPHMWSIAVEYRGSIVVYVWVLAMFALGWSPNARFWAAVGMFLYLHLAVNGWYYSGFVVGTLICDLTITSELNPSQLPKLFQARFVRRNAWMYYVLLLIGLYLGSVPQSRTAKELQEEPGWYILSYFVPSTNEDVRWFFAVFGAVCEAEHP